MPIYEYRCDCGSRFERLMQRTDAAAPACPRCGGDTAKIPSMFAVGGRADPGLSREQMPQTWRGTYNGDREYVTRLRRQWEKRDKLESRHPELAGDTRPIVAHEGRYHGNPLRAGDTPATHGHGHSHGRGHSHGHSHGS